jgi:AcrR family transcriptional regulator
MKPVSYVMPLARTFLVLPAERVRPEAIGKRCAHASLRSRIKTWNPGTVTTPPPGLRERKKQATRKALRDAALRLALERGPDNVRAGDIAEAAGVSPRTYNNYFASREQAIVAAVTAEREARVAAAVAARPASTRLADAVTEAIVEQYADPGSQDPRALLLVTTSPALRDAFLDTAAGIEGPLTAVIAGRIGDAGGQHTARVLSASVAAAVRIALQQWVRPAGGSRTATELVIPSGSLPDLLRAALAPLAPALDAAEGRPRRQAGQRLV